MADDVDRMNEPKRDNWRTPDWVLEAIEENHGPIDTDPCTGYNTEIGSKRNFDIDDDGLSQDWVGFSFVNPPFSKKKQFLKKAVEEIEREEVDTIFFITPDGTDTISWWHKYIAQEANYIWFSEGRINYRHPEGKELNSPTFGTAISIFGETTDEMLEWFSEEGHLVQTVKN